MNSETNPKPKVPRKTGRPTIYTKKLVGEICTRLAGGESLRSICRSEGMPHLSTVLAWVADGEHERFTDQYARAREAAGYAHADGVIEIVERLLVGKIDPQSAKAAMDGLKWAAERMAPKALHPRHLSTSVGTDDNYTPRTLADFYADLDASKSVQ